mgnify:CR=1 FL=1
MQFVDGLLREQGRFRQVVVTSIAVVLEPGNIEAVAALGDLFARKNAESCGFWIPACAGMTVLGVAALRVGAEKIFESGEVFARQLRALGVDSLCINRRGVKRAKTREERIGMIEELLEKMDLPVYLAGGIDVPELTALRALPLAGVIVGAAIAEAPSPVEIAKKMRTILDTK